MAVRQRRQRIDNILVAIQSSNKFTVSAVVKFPDLDCLIARRATQKIIHCHNSGHFVIMSLVNRAYASYCSCGHWIVSNMIGFYFLDRVSYFRCRWSTSRYINKCSLGTKKIQEKFSTINQIFEKNQEKKIRLPVKYIAYFAYVIICIRLKLFSCVILYFNTVIPIFQFTYII